MGIVTDFGKAIANIVSFGSKLNRDQRSEIRKAVGELADELDRALRIAQFYLEGVKNIKDPIDISSYLRNGQGTLMDTYNEYKVCDGLYELHDRFDQIFDPVKLSVSIGKIKNIHQLIHNLSVGERFIIDDLDSLLDTMLDLANELSNANIDDQADIVKKIKTTLKLEISEIGDHRKSIKRAMREIFDNM
ncbi:hypothetical protein HQ531_02400 [bacterium]|nr:hypothetical protein [bacterium]